MQSGLGILGGIGILIYLTMMLGMVAGYVILIIAVWRGMRAHENIAEILGDYVKIQKTKYFEPAPRPNRNDRVSPPVQEIEAEEVE